MLTAVEVSAPADDNVAVPPPFVVLRAVTKVFGSQGRTQALRGITLEIPKGRFIAITGPSGSGKSTLLHVIGAIEKATSGDVIVGDENLVALSENALARYRLVQVGFIFQAFHLIPSLTVAANVALPALLRGGPPRQVWARVAALLDSVGMSAQRDRLPHELSGGQQQRTAIARALVNDPPLILADEPTGNLDTATGEQVVELLQQLHTEGKTLLLVTHDAAIAARAEQEIRIRDGAIEPIEGHDTDLRTQAAGPWG
jgi:putative ABC transport system ATP-binding protein